MTADDFCFGWWDEDKQLLLITPRIYALLPNGVTLKSISGEIKTKGVDYIDQDTRFGFLAYGFQNGKATAWEG